MFLLWLTSFIFVGCAVQGTALRTPHHWTIICWYVLAVCTSETLSREYTWGRGKPGRGSLSSASVDSAMNWATCRRGCRDPSHRLLVNQSEATLRNSLSHAQYGQNMPRLAKTEKHSLVWGTVHQGMPRMPHHTSACLCL